ncbi:MAG: response regulator transcription factor [Actinomycetota bacterium]
MRILVVDDEQRLAASIARGLEAEGFTVDVVNDGHSGLWRAREGGYSAIVLDIMLPGVNGYEICRTLRDEDIWTPILLLTAKGGEYDEAEGFEFGADDYLRKPFSHVVLTARLRSLVRRASATGGSDLSAGGLMLDPVARTCRRGDEVIELTQREYAVLEMLVRWSPQVVAKQQLIDEVWGIDFAGDPNIVEVYVAYLRRKVDKPFGTRSIGTVRGIGYQLVDNGGGG